MGRFKAVAINDKKSKSELLLRGSQRNYNIAEKISENLLSVNWSAVMLCGEMIGATSLSLPSALQSLGIFAGLVTYLAVMIISFNFAVYLGQTFAEHRDKIKELMNLVHLRDPYPQLAQHTIGTKSRYVVIISILLSDFLGVAVLLLLPSVMLVDSMGILIIPSLGNKDNQRLWILINTLIIIPFSWRDRPKDNKIVGTAALVSAFVGHIVTLVMFCMAYNLKGMEKPPETSHATSSAILLSLGVLLTCADGFDVLPTLQEDMRDYRQYKDVLVRGYILFNILSFPIMIGGYLLFSQRKISDNILIELHKLAENSEPSAGGHTTFICLLYVAITFFIFQIMMSTIIQLNPTFQYLEKVIPCPDGFSWKRCVLRTIFIVFVSLFTEFSPFLIPIMSSHGTILFAILGVCIPGIMYLKTFQQVQIVKRIMISALAVIFLVYAFVNFYNNIALIMTASKDTK